MAEIKYVPTNSHVAHEDAQPTKIRFTGAPVADTDHSDGTERFVFTETVPTEEPEGLKKIATSSATGGTTLRYTNIVN